MNIVWFDLLQVGLLIVVFLGLYKLINKRKYKTAGGLLFGYLVIAFFLPPVNMTQDGFETVEALSSTGANVEMFRGKN